VSRRDDLEQAIAESYDLIKQYQAILRESESPKEKARARREIAEQRELIEGYQGELDELTRKDESGRAAEPGTSRPQADGADGRQIFISYSHSRQDSAYAHKLADALERRGFEVWIDDRIDPSTNWPRALQEQLDASAALIVLMTSGAFNRDWVQSELARAQAKGIPLFPLLLEGDVWLAVQSTQYEDVRGGRLPSERFYRALAAVVEGGL
jgi:hypothetical protein